MAEKFQMNVVPELKFPTLVFSPLATSSPRLTKMKKPKRDLSWTSSNGSDSCGNITSHLIADLDVSHIKMKNDSTTSFHTALEYVDPKAFERSESVILVTRAQLQSAIFEQKKSETTFDEKSAMFYAIVATERILWSRCRTWTGTLPVIKEDVIQYAKYACEDWYIRYTVRFCEEELEQIFENQCCFETVVAPYFYAKGLSESVLRRIFERNLVRRTYGAYLDIAEVVQLLFAVVGTDEFQSFEYWFRILDVQSTGVLSFRELASFFEDITKRLQQEGVTALPFEDVLTQYCDILGTSQWRLSTFKNNPHLAGRIFNGFVNAFRFFEEETDERMNTERADDENFGEGQRTRWQRFLDHQYDSFYCSDDLTELANTFVKSI